MGMSYTTTESDEEMLSKDQSDSPSFDEGSCGGSLGGGTVLKKGPWTSAEDAILVEYVKKHGEGNWNAVQKHSGLSRCGKSCRLRWANHLRPNLKKGAFTAEEEHLIIELHAKMGNKWARMAAHLPGRTDNEIKNYWNTRIKRRQRAGLPLYPPDVCLQALNESQQTQNINEFNSGDAPHHVLHASNYDIPEIVFDHLKSNQGVLSYAPPLPDISISSMLNQGVGSSQNYSFTSPILHRPKRLRGPEILFPGFNSSFSNGLPLLDQIQNDTYGKIHRPFGFSLPYDPDPNGKNPASFGIMPGSHALSNGNFSTSKPIGSLKLELPSLQYKETDLGSWGTSSPQQPSLDSVDAFIQSPPPTGPMQSDCHSPRNSGLLDALLHESQTLSSMKNQSSEKSSNSCVVTPGDIVDSSNLNLCETGWEEYGDPISPLGRSAASVFSECTPISESSLDEHPAPRALSRSNVKTEPGEHVTTPDEGRKISTQLNFSRPDFMLDAGWFDQSSECAKDQSVLADAISTLMGDDICGDYKQTSAESSTLDQGWGAGYNLWNNLPAVCQMTELP